MLTLRKQKGISYQQMKKIRKISCGPKYEQSGNEEHLIYFGRAHAKDHSSKVEVSGLLKIGRGKFSTSIQRGRNQPGIDFRYYSIIYLTNNNDTWKAERIIKKLFKKYHKKGAQGQQELYDVDNGSLKQLVKEVKNELARLKIVIKEIKFWI